MASLTELKEVVGSCQLLRQRPVLVFIPQNRGVHGAPFKRQLRYRKERENNG